MSKHIHCDNCNKFMYKTAPGQQPYAPSIFDHTITVNSRQYDFCSLSCQQQYVREWIWGEVTGGMVPPFDTGSSTSARQDITGIYYDSGNISSPPQDSVSAPLG